MNETASIPSGALTSRGTGADATSHGDSCYDSAGELACGWPERHSPDFGYQTEVAVPAIAARARRIRQGFDRLLTALIVLTGVLAIGLGILIPTQHLHLQTVTSGSMRPTASPGDVAVTQAVPVASLRVGDVIVFFPPGKTTPVIHRIVSITDGVVETRGDANSVKDPWRLTLSGATAYRLVAVVPLIGWLGEIQRPALIVAGLLVLLLVALELWREVRGKHGARTGP